MIFSPFATSVLKEILTTYSPKYTPEDLLALWTFTGGVAKYVELLIDQKAFTREKMIKAIICEIKRKKRLIDLTRVKDKFETFARVTGEWRKTSPDLIALSLEDM